MFQAPAIHRALLRSLLLGLAAALAACTTPSQKMDLSPDMIATPPHRMSRSEYPFDASGRYVDAWAAEGAGRYGRAMNSDHSDDDRHGPEEPERRPLPPPRTTEAVPPPPPPRQTVSSGSRPPAARPPEPGTGGSSAGARPSSQSSKKAAPKKGDGSSGGAKSGNAKPPASKPATKKKSTTHTVGRGDSLQSLSRRYGVSVSALKKANNLKSDRIIDGRKLVIPKN